MTHFQSSQKRFKNSSNLTIARRMIDDFQPVIDIRENVFKIFKLLQDIHDDSASEIKLLVWKFLITIELSIVPFDSEDLELSGQLGVICAESKFFPDLEMPIKKIVEISEWLNSNPRNPKKDSLFSCLEKLPRNCRIGLITKLTRGRMVPGWNDRTLAGIKNLYNNCLFLSDASGVSTELYDTIILPSAGGTCPLFNQLMTTYSSPEIILIHYRREKRAYLQKKTLPKGTLSMKSSPAKVLTNEPGGEDESWSVDNWVDDTYWERTRSSAYQSVDGTGIGSFEEILIPARLVVLGSSKSVFFREDHRLIEISEFIDEYEATQEFSKKFPRKLAKELSPGDLIVLRTSGSGDTLDDVTQALLEKDNRSELVKDALDWKPLLKEGLISPSGGPRILAGKLEDLGHSIRDPNYMWIWTTDIVIRPESKTLFINLINLLSDYGIGIPGKNPYEYAVQKWEQMALLIRYRMKAGRIIRDLLLNKLRQVISSGEALGDEYLLQLDGADAGDLTIFRVSGVDSTSVEIAHNRTGTIFEIEDH